MLDELGRCVVLQSDSGKWNPKVVVDDGRACSAWAQADLDPDVPGEELYVAGGTGNLHQAVHRGKEGWVSRLVGAAPRSPVLEARGRRLRFRPPRRRDACVHELGPGLRGPATRGRGRHLPPRADRRPGIARARRRPPAGRAGGRPRVAVILQNGEVALVSMTASGIERRALCAEPMSLARIARKKPADEAAVGAPEAEVVYVARVDGLILRFSEREDGAWAREIVFAGPQGPRGLAAGRFDADPRTETVAVFGYSKKVHVLSRRPGEAWRAECAYTDPGGGHWLAAAELDGRNATDELVGGGFSYHVFMVAREAGYGLAGVPGDPDVSPAARRSEAEAAAPPAPARRE